MHQANPEFDLFDRKLMNDDLWFNNEFNMVIAKSTVLREWFKRNNYFNLYSDQILFNLNKISDLNEILGPKFIFAHIMSPHPPYVFDENGKNPELVDMNYFGNEWNRKDDFINQLKFVNKKIISAVEKILINSAIDPIIIIVVWKNRSVIKVI